ncbi:YadA C-terminal domain-containing protein [Pasteurella oralis]|uniref:YadA C-terminal domain-containing protein n=1 Tax=Pasteurella oralis TaxID=1071947 RepID=UPI001FE9772C|nr:YadA C-terminal domain-containing protein [Pasteurella oralis]
MNLSKIAVGVAVSFSLASSIALAEGKTIEQKALDKANQLLSEYNSNEKTSTLISSSEYTNLSLGLSEMKKWPQGSPYPYFVFYKFLYNNLALLNDGININEEKINSNLEAIKLNQSSIGKNTLSIMENKVAIEVNKHAIEDLQKYVGSNIHDIENIKKRLSNLNKDLRRGLATQSALNGLFQPYNVGKVSLTAAVGGYQSNSAIAVGTGYRFNENIAAKAGLSKSIGGSAVSYNMGVNYEF